MDAAVGTSLVSTLVLLLTSPGVYAKDPVVRLEQGFLRGRYVPPLVGCEYNSFQGIPYASPPVGLLRFKDSQPPKKWSGIRNADKEGPICPQFDPELKEYTGDEDCLYLNVYTPHLSNSRSGDTPVMVYIHGGGFTFGSGNSRIYGPHYIIDRGVVLVTINYRLGPFGFLHLSDAAPGNAGLKDQVMALRWVQKNIDVFGGDPKRVTIFGQGAGGASVHHHMLSPLTKDLFHGAIAQSGAVLNPWAVQRDPERTTLLLARNVDCREGDNTTIIECLRHIDTEKILVAAKKTAASEMNSQRLIYFPFVPAPETTTPGVETFVSEPFDRLVTEGEYHPVPFMMGFNSKEALIIQVWSGLNLRDSDVLDKLSSRWKKVVLPELRRPVHKTKKDEAWNELQKFFMDGQNLSSDSLSAYTDMFSDLLFNEAILYTLQNTTKHPAPTTYLYHFKIDDKLNYMKREVSIKSPGACHGDDIGYLFLVELRYSRRKGEDMPDKERLKMVRLWTNFAKTGNPTPDDDETLDVKWQPYTNKEKHYMEIGPKLEQAVNLGSRNIEFWQNFYKTYTQ